jgi:predicted ATPase/DNA-binding CsgD family transcriptional regulator
VSDRPGGHSGSAVAPNNLPAEVSSFIGRDADISRGVALLAETRLLTLTGAGGCGKTRLAQRIADRVLHRYPGGVWWVELASLADEGLIADAAAAALRVRVPPGRDAVDVLCGYLETGPALVVMDNCEHLIAGVAALAHRLLRSTPGTAILATSREPLAVEGEVTWRVPSLRLPPAACETPDALGLYDAVRLFIERAAQADPGFRVSNQNAPAVARICQRLDGIPLALELAAARVRSLTPERIAAALDDRFRLLAAHRRGVVARQRTLLASVDWSHELLGPEERVVFRRLGIFAGSFTVDAADSVAGFDPVPDRAILDLLTRLVDKSLVQPDDRGRYRLLETIRQYALDRLTDAGEAEGLQERHLAWAGNLARTLESEATDAHPAALDELESEHANLRAALEWAATAGRRDQALEIMGSLAFFWAQHGHYREAAGWESRLLEGTGAPASRAVARARWGCAYVRNYGGDPVGAYERAQIGLAEARTGGDSSTAARCLHTMGASLLAFQPAGAREHLVQAAELARAAGDEWCLADALQIIAYTHLAEGDHRLAVPFLEEAFTICDRRGNQFQHGWHHGGMAWVAALRGQMQVAEGVIRQAIELARAVGDPMQQVWAGGILCGILVAAGRPQAMAEEMARLFTARQEWGGLGEALIPTFAARARLLEDPAGACAEVETIAEALIGLGDLMDGSGLMEQAARAALEGGRPGEAVRLAAISEEAAPTGWYRSAARLVRGVAARQLGDPAAFDFLHDALGYLADREILLGVPLALESLGGLLIADGQLAVGGRLLAAAETIRAETGQERLPGEQGRFDGDARIAEEGLGPEWAEVWAEGSGLTAAQAVAYARRARGSRKRPATGWGSLTPTELQVVDLAAQGLTNPEIGKRLFIGSGTVKTHLSHIFAKLNVRSRAELAAAATRRG